MMCDQQLGTVKLFNAAFGKTIDGLPEDFSFEELFKLSNKHQIQSLIYYGMANSGYKDNQEYSKLFNRVCQQIAFSEKQQYLINKIFDAFDLEKIHYMPLKGVLLKPIYPKTEMRVMSDADILIKLEQKDKIREIMNSIGFVESPINSDHEWIWSCSNIRVELHKRLIPSYNEDYFEYYGDGWKLARCDEGKTRYYMSAEDNFIYLFTHFSKHYRAGGIGCRHLIDLWVYLDNNKGLDDAYIEKELKKLELFEFYKNILKTIDVWFNDGPQDEVTDIITDFIFNSGAYGTSRNMLTWEMVKRSKTSNNLKKAKFSKILFMFFPPHSVMCSRYKFLEKVPFLLPLMWIVRAVETMLFKAFKIKSYYKSVNDISNEEISEYEIGLNLVGLDFKFKG